MKPIRTSLQRIVTARALFLAFVLIGGVLLSGPAVSSGAIPAYAAPPPPNGLSVDVPILLYHKVADTRTSCSSLWVTRSLFERQMVALHAYGYSTISLRDFLNYRNGIGTPPAHPFILTFDDGYENFYTTVRPVLNSFGFRAICFLPTDYIDASQRQDNSWDRPEADCPAPMLLWPEVATMLAEGYAFGSHTQSHPYLRDRTLSEAKQEIEGSKASVNL